MMISLALTISETLADAPPGKPIAPVFNDWARTLNPRTFRDIFPPIDLPEPNRVKGIGEDWFRRELEKGLDLNKQNRLNYHGPVKLSLEKESDGDSQNQES